MASARGTTPAFSLGPSCPRLRRYPRPIWATSPPRSGKSTRWRGSASTASTRPPGDVAPRKHRAKDPPPAPASRHRHPARTPSRFSAGADSHARPPRVVVASLLIPTWFSASRMRRTGWLTASSDAVHRKSANGSRHGLLRHCDEMPALEPHIAAIRLRMYVA